jgi:apolipoprotein N-acyltransferase
MRLTGLLGAVGLGFVFGTLFSVGGFYWLNIVSGVNPLDFLIMVVVLSVYYLLFALCYRLSIATAQWCMLLVAPALWVSLEYARASMFFLSLPWNFLGHSQFRLLPVIQVADLTGVYGISFVVLMVNQFLSEGLEVLLRSRGVRGMRSVADLGVGRLAGQAALVLVVVFLVLGYGYYRLGEEKSGDRVRIAIVQPNLITRDTMPLSAQTEQLAAYGALTREAGGGEPSLIVWPASSLPAPLATSGLVRATVASLAKETRAHLLVGGAGMEKAGPRRGGLLPYANSEYLIAPDGSVSSQYNKIRLVPFNEYLPLEGKIQWPKWITTLKHSLVPGDTYTLFQVSQARFGVPICWESLFPDLFRRFVAEGANLMVSVTNEGFMGRTSAPYQTLAMTCLRAVENRVAVVRSAPTGLSAFIAPTGAIEAKVEDEKGEVLFVKGALVRDVTLARNRTFYTAHGDVFAQAAVVIGALAVLAYRPFRAFLSFLRTHKA